MAQTMAIATARKAGRGARRPVGHEAGHEAPKERGPKGRGPERRCLVTGQVQPAAEMIRFVLGPDDAVVPDIGGVLAGRGLWLTARRDIVETACAKGLFAKAARCRAHVPADLADCVERLLVRRCLDLVGLARRSGQVASGFEKVRAWLGAGRAAILFAAVDGAEDGRGRLRAMADGVPIIALFDGAELGAALGRSRTVHAVVAPGGLAGRILQEAARVAGFRAPTATAERGKRSPEAHQGKV